MVDVARGAGRQKEDWSFEWLVETLSRHEACKTSPAVSQEARRSRDPFRVLVATILSARTRDEMTAQASEALFRLASTPQELLRLQVHEVEKAIRPVNFYKTKAKRLLEVARVLVERFGGNVPAGMDELLSLPGVGRKTANLVLAEGLGLDGVCVDTHVHRILNRLGVVSTKRPEETEARLREVLPRRYWRVLNPLLVSFGQRVCRPISPFCSRCPLSSRCRRIGVSRSR